MRQVAYKWLHLHVDVSRLRLLRNAADSSADKHGAKQQIDV